MVTFVEHTLMIVPIAYATGSALVAFPTALAALAGMRTRAATFVTASGWAGVIVVGWSVFLAR